MKTFRDNFKFRKYSVTNGLSQNVVYSINQDRKGFIWICTQQGLNRFDGKEFRVYKNNPEDDSSIINDLVYSSYLSKSGRLWFGTINGGFFEYNEEENNFRNYIIPDGNVHGQSKQFVFDFAEDKSGSLYISIFGAGLYKFHPDKKSFSKSGLPALSNDTMKKTTKILFDSEDNLWFGTWDNGIYKYNPEKNHLRNFREGNDYGSICNNRIRFIFADSEKRIWVGTQNGLNLYDPAGEAFSKQLSNLENEIPNFKNTFTCMEEDKNGRLWIGTSSSGIIYFNTKNDEYSLINSREDNPDGLSGNSIMHLFNDRSNVLWAGTYDDGLNKTDCERKKFFDLNSILKAHKKKLSVLSICKDKNDKLFIGTAYDDLLTIDLRTGEFWKIPIYLNRAELPERHTVTCIHRDCYDDIYFCLHTKGMFKYNENLEKTEHYNYPKADSECTVFSIADYDNDNMWIGTREYGLLIFSKKNKSFRRLDEFKKIKGKTASDEIKALLKDSKGNLWIGTDVGGLSYLDIVNGKITNYRNKTTDKNSISEDYITSLCEDDNGNIWAGTINKGINKFNRSTNSFKRFSVESGLPDNTVRAIEKDNHGNIWISTNNGISKLNTEKEIFRNYEHGDGLQSKEFNDRSSYRSDDGLIFFGGINGVNMFRPEEIKDNPYLPEIALTDFKLFNQSLLNSADNPFLKKSITVTEEINLTYRESVISFEFASLVYNNVSKNKYAYKLEGFDKDWTYCGNRRFATYTSIEPGNYVFRVIGSNNDDLWNEKGVSVKISITPPFWKTLWFKSFGVAAITGLTGLAYSRKLNKIKLEKKSQEEFSKRLLESREEERKKISSGLHNTIAHGILITKNKAEIALKNMSDASRMTEALKQISELTSSTLNDLRSITYSLHPHQLERLGLTKAIKSIINNVEKSTEIKFTAYIENLDKLFSPDLEINIYRIVQECLNNIIKHSEATESHINISVKDERLDILISDNGKGIDVNAVKGIGMNELNERVKLYNGVLNIESKFGKGTILKILIPIINQYENRKED